MGVWGDAAGLGGGEVTGDGGLGGCCWCRGGGGPR